tara:strand:- start:289 stop:1257 length:969 start_codon:yes stop_codon:yes gene_type:complete
MKGAHLEIEKIGSDTRMLLRLTASDILQSGHLSDRILHNNDGSGNPSTLYTWTTHHGAELWFSANLGSGNTCNNLEDFELSTKSQPYWPTGGTYTDTFGGAFGSDCTQYSLPAKINTSTGEETYYPDYQNRYDAAGDYDDGAGQSEWRGYNRICSEKAATVQVTAITSAEPYVVDSKNMITTKYHFPKLVAETNPTNWGVLVPGSYQTTVGSPISITFTLTNTGTEDLTLTSISDSAFPAGLSLISNISDTTLSRMETTTFVVRIDAVSTTPIDPTYGVPTWVTAEVEIVSDDPLYKPDYPDFPQPDIPENYKQEIKFLVYA